MDDLTLIWVDFFQILYNLLPSSIEGPIQIAYYLDLEKPVYSITMKNTRFNKLSQNNAVNKSVYKLFVFKLYEEKFISSFKFTNLL